MKFTRSGLPGVGPQRTKVGVILPSASYQDKYFGMLAADSYGGLLKWALSQGGMYSHQVWFTSRVSHPDGNNEDKEFRRELSFLKEKVGVEVLVALGDEVASFFNCSPVAKTRGSVYEWEGFYVLPTYAPHEIRSLGGGNKKKGKADFAIVWISDFRKAREIATEGWHPPEEKFVLSPTFEELQNFVHATRNRRLAVDIETTGTGETAELVMVGVATDEEQAMVIPFLQKGGLPYWLNGQRKEVTDLLRSLFVNNELIFQNALFDVPMLRGFGFDIPWENVKHDTMLLHHVLTPEMPHNLGFIVSIYGATPYWKEDVSERLGSNMELEDETFRLYNARDCVVLHQVLQPMLEDLEELELEDTYYNESIAMLPVIDAMQTNGIGYDPKRLEIFISNAEIASKKLEEDIRNIALLPEGFNLNSDDDLRWYFYRLQPPKFQKLRDLDDYNEKEFRKYECENEDCKRRTFWGEDSGVCPKCGETGTATGETKLSTRKSPGTKAHNTLLDLKAISKVTSPFYPRGYKGRKTNTGKVAVNQQSLLGLQRATQNEIHRMRNLKRPPEEEIEKARLLLEIIDKYFEYAGLQKLLSTYRNFTTGADGRVHTHFLIHGTATGRLSSSNPNLQNIPKKELGIRKAFVSSHGKVFLSLDYQNLEVHVLAYESEDDVLIDAIRQGVNIHDMNTKTLFNLTPEDKQWKLARRAAKIFMFGGISYGGSDEEIYQKVILEAPQLALTLAEFKNAKSRYMQAHPKYAEWADRVVETALRDRVSKTFLGRKRLLTGSESDIRKQALNTPIQGGAGGVINRAMVRIHNRFQGTPYTLVLQIHDQLIAEVPEGQVPEALEIMKEEMEKPINFYGVMRSFPTDAEVGTSWGELEEYKT